MGLVEIKYDWVSIKDIVVPEDRYWSRMESEDYESLKEAVRKLGENFSRLNPIKLATAKADGELMLIDGANRLNAYRELGLEKIFSIIAIYETMQEAEEEARWGSVSENWIRAQREPAQLIELIRKWTIGMEKSQAVQLIIKHTSYTKRYAYMLLEIAGDEEISRKIIEEGLSIYKAIELLREKGKVYISEIISQETEKPEKPIISAREEKIEEIKPSTVISEEIKRKKPTFEEIFQKAVEKLEGHLLRPMNATLKAHMKDALSGLKIMNVDELMYILMAAENNWGKEKSDVIKKAVWIWRKKLDELGDWVKWPTLNYEEILKEAREAVEEEKKARKAERGLFGLQREREPRREPKPKVEVEEKAEKAVREFFEPKPKVEESPETVEAEAIEEERLSKEVLKEEVEKTKEEFRKMLLSYFPGVSETRWVTDDYRMEKIYGELGPLGVRILLEKCIRDIKEIIRPWWSSIKGRIEGPKPYPPEPVFLKKKEEIIETILKKYEAEGKKIIEMREKLGGELWDALHETIKNSTVKVISSHDGRRFLILCEGTPKVLIGVKRDIFVNEGLNRLSEALAWLSEGDCERGGKLGEATVDIIRLNPIYGSVPIGFQPFITGVKCPSCGLLRDHITGLPVNCKCGWPTMEKKYRETPVTGAREVD
jgi:hypothetical protein